MARKKHYNYYDDDFKATAVALGSLPGVEAQAVAGVLDIYPVMLYRWKKELREGRIVSKSTKGSLDTETKKELSRLRRIEKAHEQLKMEHELLKKSIQYSLERRKRSSSS